MAKQTIGLGSAANDGTGDNLRAGGTKINANFTELYDGLGGLLSKSGASSALTGSTSETALATVTIPANTIGANGSIRVRARFTMTNSGNNKTLKVRLGGIAGAIVYTAVDTTHAGTIIDCIISNSNATNAQTAHGVGCRPTDLLIQLNTISISATVDMTSSQDLVITGQLASAGETITITSYDITYIK